MKKNFLRSTSSLGLLGAILLSGGMAHAQQEMGTLSYYEIPESEIRDHYHEWAVFMQYQMNREPCQNYQAPPAGYEMKGCDLYRKDTVKVVEATARTETVTRIVEPAVVSQVDSASSYTLHFGLGKFDIPADEKAVLARVAQEIKKHTPSEVIVSGYASTLGSHANNKTLSERRAQTVAYALADMGINPEIIHQRSYGETSLEVQTADGVKMPPNRRVVIQFNH